MNTKEKNNNFDFARVNSMGLKCYSVLAICLEIMILISAFQGKKTLGYLVVYSFLLIAPLAATVIISKKNMSDERIMHGMGIGYAIFYTFVLLTDANVYAFIFVMPLLIVVMAYNNMRFSKICSVGVLVVNVIYEVMKYVRLGTDGYNVGDGGVKLVIQAIMTIFILIVSKLLIELNRQKVEAIEKEKENVYNLLNKIVEVTETITDVIENVSSEMGKLDESVSDTCDYMQEVSNGTANTAESIEVQLERTEEIYLNIKDVENASTEIISNIKLVEKEIEDGSSNIESLIDGVDGSERAGKDVTNELTTLNEYTKKMNGIIEVINNITEQTSMLALNASIEAARAGEQGKGFLVVANEISRLAEQTKDATVDIASLINNVSGELVLVLQVIDRLIKQNGLQNVAATKIVSTFKGIEGSMGSMARLSSNLTSVIERLDENNAEIIESTKSISDITKEVSENSNKTYEISDTNKEIVRSVKSMVNSLTKSCEELNSCYNVQNDL